MSLVVQLVGSLYFGIACTTNTREAGYIYKDNNQIVCLLEQVNVKDRTKYENLLEIQQQRVNELKD